MSKTLSNPTKTLSKTTKTTKKIEKTMRALYDIHQIGETPHNTKPSLLITTENYLFIYLFIEEVGDILFKKMNFPP